MDRSQKVLLALVVGSFISVGAQADVSSQPYIGAKIGQFMIDDSSDYFDDATAYGV